MGEQVINSFQSGMNQDYAKTIQQKDSYVEALNFRITTENGQSTGILSNVKGNTLAIQIPDTSNILEFIAIPERFINPVTLTLTITSPSGIITTIPLTWNTPNGINLFDDFANFINNESSLISYGIIAFSTGHSTKLYSNLFYNLSLVFTNSGFIVNTIIPTQTNLIPIGSTNIRDEIFILTTSASNINPTQDGINKNASQIWKLTYDEALIDREPLSPSIFTITLLYNNRLDFSLSYPIAPTAIKGNYENPTTKKIYWCDFHNKIRNFNTADVNGFFIPIGDIDSAPDLNEGVAILQSINENGVLPAGIYQYTYRLLNTTGATTRFNNLSNPIHIVPYSETSTNVKTYVTNSYNLAVTNKSTTIKITGIDTSYDRIEIAYVRRTTLTTIPNIIAIISNEPIDKTSGIATLKHDGRELEDIISLEELVNPVRSVDVCKTMAIKDSILLIGNVKVSSLDLNFDARAFRYTGINATGTNSIGQTVNPLETYSHNILPDIDDDINPTQAPQSSNNYLYQINGTTLGGQGANISYEFVTTGLHVDDHIPPTVTGPYYAGTIQEQTNINLGISGQNYPNYSFNNLRSPYIESVLRGYQRDETYRFGIQFFDLKGNAVFVKWIADIRFPNIYMPDVTQSDPEQRTNQFKLLNGIGGSDPNWYSNNLGIKFTVNVSLIADQISGFSIVRVKREQGDKTILAQGLCQPSFLSTDNNGNTYTALQNATLNNTTGGFASHFMSMLSPEVFFQEYFGQINGSSSDSVEIIDILESSIGGSQGAYKRDPGSGALSAVPTSAVGKYYQSILKTLNAGYRASTAATGGGIGKIFQVRNTFSVQAFFDNPNIYLDPNGDRIINISSALIGGGQSTYFSQGGTNLAVHFNTNITGFENWENVGFNTPNYLTNDGILGPFYKKYLVNYKRAIANQYGGNTLTQRSLNNYILCNHYQPVNPNQTIYTSNVYGGDIFLNVFDQNDQRKPLTYAAATINVTAINEGTITGTSGALHPKFFPVESVVNVNLRSKDGDGPDGLSYPTVNTAFYYDGVGPAGDPGNGGTALGLDIHEANSYNTMFSNENDIQIFIPKPIPFIEQNVFDNRIYASGVKINGELTDSWDTFAAGDYKDVDGTYGPINAIITNNNQLHFLQDRAIGILPVFPRAVLNNAGTLDSQLQIGLGNKLDKHQYISTDTGTKHQWSVTESPEAIYYYDVLAKKLMQYKGGINKLSDIKGMHAYFDRHLTGFILNNDNPVLANIVGQNIGGICSVYDYKNNEIILTFLDSLDVETKNKFTIAYNELADCFTSFYSFTPSLYITNRQIYLSPDNNTSNNLYVHNRGSYSEFYDILYPSTLKLIVNENPITTKVFDNQVFETESINTSGPNPININNDNINTIRMYNDYQNTDYQNLITDVNITRKERSVNIAIPRNRVLYTNSNSPDIFTDLGIVPFSQRIRDKYLTCDYIYNNINNYRFLIHNIKTQYRISVR